MKCDHPDCTGIHAHGIPMAQWCPTAVEKHLNEQRAADARRSRTPGTYAFDRANGIGRPGLVARQGSRALADARDTATLEALIATIEGTSYGPFD